MLLKSGLFLPLLFTLQAFQIKDLHNQGFSGLKHVKYRHFLEASRPNKQIPSLKTADSGRRTKRSALFTTGVKICPQESMKGVITSHQAYYKLRVCQEAIWEAFHIFFERVPNSEEYRAWVHTCQHENICMDDLARNFSSSQEHLDLVARRVAELAESEGGGVATPGPGRDCTWTPPLIVLPTEEVESEDQNMLPGEYEHTVEFSVTVVNSEYSELLSDPEDPRYHVITEHLTEQMLHILEKVPGFKEIRVLGFRSEDVAVRYAAVFDGDIDLGQEEPGQDVSGSKLKHIVANALSHATSLELDIQTLSFGPETIIYRVDEMRMDPHETVASQDIASPPPTVGDSVPSLGLFPTVSVTEKSVEALTVTSETQTVVPFMPNNLPETTSGVSEETPAMAAIEESVEDNFEGATDVMPPTQMTAEKEEGDVSSRSEEDVSNVEVVKEEPQHEESLQLSPDVKPMPTATPEANPAASESTDPEAEVPIYTPSSDEDTVRTGIQPAILEPGVEIGAGIEDVVLPASTENGVSAERRDEPVHSGMTAASVDIPDLPARSTRTEAVVTEPLEVDISGSGLPSESEEQPYESTAAPAKRQMMSTPLMMTADNNKELVVFFSLRVTNMLFSEDLFNKSSPEYRSLENTFLELLLPYLESNLTGFKRLEILNFRNGSVVVNSRMRLDQPVPSDVTQAVHCVLEDFCHAASKRLDIEIDSRSLDIEPAEMADPCKFLACNEFSRCVVNSWTGEPECLCDSGYRTVDGQPCQSTCALEPDFCSNGGLCEIIPGHGATCRCPVGTHWHYHGERCNEVVAVALDRSMIATSLVGSLCLVCAIIGILVFIKKKCKRTRKAVTLVQPPAPYAFENTVRLNPVFENDDGALAQTSTLQCPSSFTQSPHSETFASIENIHLSIEIPRHLYTTRSEKLVSEMVDFHQCISHNEMWRSPNEYRASCLLRSDNDCFEVTVL